jgi:hypothetical protein
MFDSKSRYMTSGIQQEVPLELQLFLWSCIDSLKNQGKELDYLQVFEITSEICNELSHLNIEHRQEVPEYKKTYIVPCDEPINAKIFVIDDGEYITMLLAEEY